MTQGILVGVTVVFVAVTLIQYWSNPSWWIRGWDFPKLQIGALLLVLLLIQLVLLDFSNHWNLLLPPATLGCLAYQWWWIRPYTPLVHCEADWADPNDDGPRIRILSSNVLTPNRHADRLIALVRQYRPDVLVTLESDQWWEDQLQVLSDDYPFSIRCPLDNLYGMHAFSRLPLENQRLSYLVQDNIPSMHARLRVNDELGVRMHFLHPAPPSPTENDESTERDVELLIVGRSVKQTDEPVIITGDLNDVAWSPTTRLFRKISGLLDPRIGRGMFNTFHAQHRLLRWPLDHFFHSAHFRVVRIKRLTDIGSDHFPMFIELQYDRRHASEQHSLDTHADDRARMQNKVAQEPASKDDVPHP